MFNNISRCSSMQVGLAFAHTSQTIETKLSKFNSKKHDYDNLVDKIEATKYNIWLIEVILNEKYTQKFA